jgi:hypothetical protein
VFGSGGGNGGAQPAIDVKSLHAKIGELTLENDSLETATSALGSKGWSNRGDVLSEQREERGANVESQGVHLIGSVPTPRRWNCPVITTAMDARAPARAQTDAPRGSCR